MKKTLLTLLIATVAMAPAAWATPLNRAHVPADTQWLFHIDIDAAIASDLGALLSRDIPQFILEKILEIAEVSGSNPMTDFHGVTLIGTDADDTTAAILIYGQFNRARLLSLLAGNEAYAESEYEDQKLYHWVDHLRHRNQVGTFAREDLIVISQSEDTVKAVLDVVAGSRESMVGADIPPTPENAILIAAADNVGQLSRHHPTAVLQNTKTMAVVIAENNGHMHVQAHLIAETVEAATQIEQVLTGMYAFFSLQHGENPYIMDLLAATTLQRTSKQMTLTFEYPSVKLYELFQVHMAAKTMLQELKTGAALIK